MSGTTEAFSRVKIDAFLKDPGWNLSDGTSARFEHALPDGSWADYALCDRSGRPVAAVEAKRVSVNPIAAQDQGRHYAEQLGVRALRVPVERRGDLVPRPRDGCARAKDRHLLLSGRSGAPARRPQDGRIRMPVPEPQLQQKFSAAVGRIRDMVNTIDTSTRVSLSLSACLMPCLLGNTSDPGAGRA